MKARDRSNSVIQEEENELLGYQPHIRTIMEDIDAGINRKVLAIIRVYPRETVRFC